MKKYYSLIDNSQIFSVIGHTLHYIDKRLVEHGERVAYIVNCILSTMDKNTKIDQGAITILSVLHDIGAYKTEEIDEMTIFETRQIWSHSIYGYLFLKDMSPIGEMAEAILYHHLDYKDYSHANSNYLDYAALIYIADRIDILIQTQENCDFQLISKDSGDRFDPKFVDLFFKSNPDEIAKNVKSGHYHTHITEIFRNLEISREDAFEYLKMMAFSIDFRSEYTVNHTINTTSISVYLGQRFKLSIPEMSKLYVGALLHDIGKVAIDPAILEFPGRLSTEQMTIMKTHVDFTRKIIYGMVERDISNIAYRHHEKLDGSGYPNGLTEKDLSLSEQIVAVSDILSALTNRRSYKDAFSKEKTLAIISDMQNSGQLSFEVCQIVINDFDDLIEKTAISSKPIIDTYNKMLSDYNELNQRIQALTKDAPNPCVL